MGHGVRSQRSEVGGQTTEDRWFKVLNTRPPRLSPPQADDGGQVEPQNKKPQNDEVITSIFPPEADSTFCGSKGQQPKKTGPLRARLIHFQKNRLG